MMRLELLEVREPNSVNQVNPTLVISPDCTYCHALTHLFEEYPVHQAQHIFPENMNAAYTRPNYNPYSKTYNPGWKNHPNFSWSQSSPEQPGQQLSNQFTAQAHQPNFHQSQPNFQSTYQHNFQPTYQHQQQNHPDKKMSDLERMIETMSKNQASMMNNHNQAINRLEVQLGQLANSLHERQKGTLSSQPLPNPMNPLPID